MSAAPQRLISSLLRSRNRESQHESLSQKREQTPLREVMTAECPTCGDEFNTKHGMRIHHYGAHGERLPNRTCQSCGKQFYDDESKRTYCDECDPPTTHPDKITRTGKEGNPRNRAITVARRIGRIVTTGSVHGSASEYGGRRERRTMGAAGFEPATTWSEAKHSVQTELSALSEGGRSTELNVLVRPPAARVKRLRRPRTTARPWRRPGDFLS